MWAVRSASSSASLAWASPSQLTSLLSRSFMVFAPGIARSFRRRGRAGPIGAVAQLELSVDPDADGIGALRAVGGFVRRRRRLRRGRRRRARLTRLLTISAWVLVARAIGSDDADGLAGDRKGTLGHPTRDASKKPRRTKPDAKG